MLFRKFNLCIPGVLIETNIGSFALSLLIPEEIVDGIIPLHFCMVVVTFLCIQLNQDGSVLKVIIGSP
jgi:hypothetical protein